MTLRKTINALPAYTAAIPDDAVFEAEIGGVSAKVKMSDLRGAAIPGGIPDLTELQDQLDQLSASLVIAQQSLSEVQNIANTAAATEAARQAAVVQRGIAQTMAEAAIAAKNFVEQDFSINTAAIIAQALRQDDLDTIFAARTLVAGQSVSVKFQEFKNEQTTENSAVNSRFALLGAQTSDGSAWNLSGTTLRLNGAALGETISELGVVTADTTATVTSLQEALVDETGGYARASQLVTAGGETAGYAASTSGGGQFVMIGQKIGVATNAAGANLTDLMSFNESLNRWVFGNIYTYKIVADTIETQHLQVGSVVTDRIETTGIRRSYSAELASNFIVPLASGTRDRVLSLSMTKQIDASSLYISSMMRPRPGLSYACQFQFGRTTSGTDIVLDTIWFWMPNVTLGGYNSLRIPVVFVRNFFGIPAGDHDIWVDIIAYAGGDSGSFLETGSNMDVEERKR